jgi:hypothetical protein
MMMMMKFCFSEEAGVHQQTHEPVEAAGFFGVNVKLGGQLWKSDGSAMAVDYVGYG